VLFSGSIFPDTAELLIGGRRYKNAAGENAFDKVAMCALSWLFVNFKYIDWWNKFS